jgi:hypothetical protein
MKLLQVLLIGLALVIAIMGMIVLRTEISYAHPLYCSDVNCNNQSLYDCTTKCQMPDGSLKWVLPIINCYGDPACANHPNAWCQC